VIVSKEMRELESVETGNQQESHYKEVFLNKVVNKTVISITNKAMSTKSS